MTFAGQTSLLARITTFALALVISIGATPLTAQVSAPNADSPLQKLSAKTGWIQLGALTKDRKSWAGGSDPNVDFLTGGFELLDRKVDRRQLVLPKVGERIRLTTKNEITILDFGTTGEKCRLDSPSSANRPLQPGDGTGQWLMPGAVVQVRAVVISPPYGQMRIAWARVVPIKVE